MAAKLHEVLAVWPNLKSQSEQTRASLAATFASKRHLFEEKLSTFKPNETDKPNVTEAQSSLQTTLDKEIDWISNIFGKTIDTGYQTDLANTKAASDLVLDNGEVLLKSVPATALLQLEHRLDELRILVSQIPTLDPAKGFKLDPDRGKGIYKARVVHKERTKKVPKVLTLAPATDKHPAQVEKIFEDVAIGALEEQEWSSLTTPAIKADLIANVDTLLRAVKKARSRANESEVDQTDKISDKLFGYVFRPLHEHKAAD